MKFSFNEKDFLFLEQHLIQPLKEKGLKVYLFGSRANGKNHPYSDVDILIEGEFNQEADRLIFEIKDFFEESNFPFNIDLVKNTELAKSYRENVFNSKIQL